MSTVVPPTPLPPPQVPNLPRPTVLSAPPALTDLAIGAKLDVIVSTMPEGNRLLLDTPLGPVTLSLPFKPVVAPGQALMLHLIGLPTKGADGAAGQPKVALSLPDGKPVPAFATAPTGGAPGTAAQQASGLPTVPGAVRLSVGTTVGATLIRPVTLSPLGILQAATSTPGASTQQTPGPVAQLAPPAPGAAPSVPSQPGQAATTHAGQPNTSGQPGSTQGTQPQQSVQVPAGSTLVLKIVTVTPPTGPSPSLTPPPAGSPVSLAPGATLTGTVTGQQGAAQAVVQTHAGPVALPTDRPLAPGTQITFELISLKPAPPTPGVHAAGTSGIRQGAWPVLSETLNALGDLSPGAQTHLLQTSMPRADAQLATNIIFFLSAIRGGDMKSWLGDGPARILERQRPDLAARLKDDVAGAARRVHDPDTGDWRQFSIPFLHDGELDRIQLLSRDGSDQEDDDGNPGGTRFVVDLNLTVLGHLQIDGLVGAKGRRLDVVVRTDEPLGPDMRQDIRALYTNALEVTGMDGSVGFQAAPGNFVKVAARPDAQRENTVV